MKEELLLDSLTSLQRQSRTSLFLVLLGTAFLVWSVYYSASRLRPLEEQVATKKADLAQINQEIEIERAKLTELQRSYDQLKTNTETLYSVRVTPNNAVYEVKASAIATGRQLSQGRPEYKFSMFINASKEALEQIESVTYVLDHETFKTKDYVSTDRATFFAKSYVGWGCLTAVEVKVKLKSGTVNQSEFDMCRSLGPEWK